MTSNDANGYVLCECDEPLLPEWLLRFKLGLRQQMESVRVRQHVEQHAKRDENGVYEIDDAMLRDLRKVVKFLSMGAGGE